MQVIKQLGVQFFDLQLFWKGAASSAALLNIMPAALDTCTSNSAIVCACEATWNQRLQSKIQAKASQRSPPICLFGDKPIWVQTSTRHPLVKFVHMMYATRHFPGTTIKIHRHSETRPITRRAPLSKVQANKANQGITLTSPCSIIHRFPLTKIQM